MYIKFTNHFHLPYYITVKEVIFLYIIIGSITTATRLAKYIEKYAGVPASVAHTPTAIGGGGCSYSVRVSDRSLDIVRPVIADADIHVKAMYTEETKGRRREFHEVS